MMMTTKIKPTVGRVVWFTPPRNSATAGFVANDPMQPCAAIVAYVWADDMVNLHVIDHNGVGHSRTSVPLIQPDEPKPEDGFFCSWMPFQVGQAKAAA
jgi:hypothetical protein